MQKQNPHAQSYWDAYILTDEQIEFLRKMLDWMDSDHKPNARGVSVHGTYMSLITNTLKCGTYGDCHRDRLNKARELYIEHLKKQE